MLHRALKMWFWVTYDHLGKLVLLNLACMLPVALLTGLALALPRASAALVCFLTYAVLVPACLAAFGHVARQLIEKREATLADFLTGLRQFGLQGAALGALLGAAILLSLGGAWYYLIVMASPTPLYAYPLAAICLWCGALAGAVAAFALPALSQKRAGLAAALRTGLLLTADNPLYAAAITLNLLGLAVFSSVPPVFLLCSLAPMATLQAAAYEMLARKYAAPIVDGKRTIDFHDETDDLLNRGLKDFFFPWKM